MVTVTVPQRSNNSHTPSSCWLGVLISCGCTAAVVVAVRETWRRRRGQRPRSLAAGPSQDPPHPNQQRAQWHTQEEACYGHETLPSILHHFEDVRLVQGSTICQANQKRTLSYYSKARHAHQQSLVQGIPHLPTLIQKRNDELYNSILKYHGRGNQSHRTVIVMMDRPTQDILEHARSQILSPLMSSNDDDDDMTTPGVWIPALNVIPPSDMHVTVAIPWWWHTMLEPPSRNEALSRALFERLKQALVWHMHFPFSIELERILLLGGKTLVALWRTVGPRYCNDSSDTGNSSDIDNDEDGALRLLEDRHSTEPDPMVRLRREIVQCFTQEHPTIARPPLTYHTHKQQQQQQQQQQAKQQQDLVPQQESSTATNDTISSPLKQKKKKWKQQKFQHRKSPSMPVLPSTSPPPQPPASTTTRPATIEFKTPGMGEGDGFIHTTLARLPLDCLASHDIELAPLHRLCREATAMYAGHRMRIHQYRFLETTGAGGDSNPCVDPIFDEYLQAPIPAKMIPRKQQRQQRRRNGAPTNTTTTTNTTSTTSDTTKDTSHHVEQHQPLERPDHLEGFIFSAAAASAMEPKSYHPAATIGALPPPSLLLSSSSSQDNLNTNKTTTRTIPLSDLFVSNPEL